MDLHKHKHSVTVVESSKPCLIWFVHSSLVMRITPKKLKEQSVRIRETTEDLNISFDSIQHIFGNVLSMRRDNGSLSQKIEPAVTFLHGCEWILSQTRNEIYFSATVFFIIWLPVIFFSFRDYILKVIFSPMYYFIQAAAHYCDKNIMN